MLIVLLIVGFTPTYAAGISILAAIAASWLGRTPMGPRAILEALELGARNMISTGAPAGRGRPRGQRDRHDRDRQHVLADDRRLGRRQPADRLVLVALASLVLGMGLPVTASYIVLATLSAPAIYNLIAAEPAGRRDRRRQPAGAAKAIFMLVAPEAIASLGQPMARPMRPPARQGAGRFPGQLIAAGAEPGRALDGAALRAHDHLLAVAGLQRHPAGVPHRLRRRGDRRARRRWRPGSTAWRIAKGLYIIPLLFAYTDFLAGDFWRSLWIFAFGSVGIFALTAAIAGHLEGRISWPERALLVATGTALLWPTGPWVNVPGFLFFLLLFGLDFWRARKRRPQPAAA